MEEIVISQVVPDVTDTSLAVVRNFRRDMADSEAVASIPTGTWNPRGLNRIDAVSLEGYIIGRFVAVVVDRLDGDLERDRFLAAARHW